MLQLEYVLQFLTMRKGNLMRYNLSNIFLSFFVFLPLNTLSMQEIMSLLPFKTLSSEELKGATYLPEHCCVAFNKNNIGPVIAGPLSPCVLAAFTNEKTGRIIAAHIHRTSNLSHFADQAHLVLGTNPKDIRGCIYSSYINPKKYRMHGLWGETHEDRVRTVHETLSQKLNLKKGALSTILYKGPKYDNQADRYILLDGTVNRRGKPRLYSCDKDFLDEAVREDYVDKIYVQHFGRLKAYGLIPHAPDTNPFFSVPRNNIQLLLKQEESDQFCFTPENKDLIKKICLGSGFATMAALAYTTHAYSTELLG